MTKQSRRKYSAGFKTKVVLEAVKNQKTLAELSQQNEVNANLLLNIATLFQGCLTLAIIYIHDNSIKS